MGLIVCYIYLRSWVEVLISVFVDGIYWEIGFLRVIKLRRGYSGGFFFNRIGVWRRKRSRRLRGDGGREWSDGVVS